MNASAVAGQGQVRDDLAYLTRLAGALTGRAQGLRRPGPQRIFEGPGRDARRRQVATGLSAPRPGQPGHRRLTRPGRLVEVPGEADRPTPGDPVLRCRGPARPEHRLDRLPLLTRQILVLRYLEDQTVEDISQILGRPAGTIRRIAAEGRRRLSALLPVYNGKGPTP